MMLASCVEWLSMLSRLHNTSDKLLTEVDHLERLMNCDELDAERCRLALSVAKRVRRDSTLLVRLLASHRDQLQPTTGGTSS